MRRSDRRGGATATMRAAAAIALVFALCAAARANCQLKVAEMPVTMKGSRAVATVGINGVSVPLTIDSGAFYSFLTDAAASQLNLHTHHAPDGLRVDGVTGVVDIRVARVERLKLFKGEIPNVEFLVGSNDLGHGSMGLLGRNLMSVGDVEFDLAHGVIRFATPNADCDDAVMAYWAGSAPVATVDLDVRNWEAVPALRATGQLNGKDVDIDFDTGAPTSFVSLRAARRAGVDTDEMTANGRVTGAGEGSARSWTARFKSFGLGGEVISNNRIEVADIDSPDTDMFLGMDFFLSHRIYVSQKQKRIYFTYNGGAVFALNSSVQAPLGGASDPEPALDADGYARRGAAFAARREHEKALADFDRAVALAPASAEYRAQRGLTQLALQHATQARADLDEALRLDPQQQDALLARAMLRAMANEQDGALADLDALDKALAPQAQMRLQVARAFELLSLPERALAQWGQWLASHPNDQRVADVLNQRCWMRTMQDIDLDKALKDCDKAVDLDDTVPDYIDSRGWTYLRMGKLSKAVSDFDRALKLKPTSAWSLYGRGIAQVRLGDAEQARADLAAARKLVPTIDDEARQHGISPDVKPGS